jgi:prepilin-type processing-associated H-X9-DG protein
MSQIEATTPTSINVNRGAGQLTVLWADGHRTEYAATALRLLCPCAFCRGEAGQPGWLDTNPTLSDEQTQMVAAGLVGQYALNVTWADGHDTGYYTFESLRENCSCPACTAERELR